MTRRPARATVAVVLALGPLLLTPASAHGTSGRVAATPVRHLVVMTQDEHSFDNYLGSRRGVDGLGAAVCQPATVRGRAVCLLPRALTSRGPRPSLNPSAAAERVSVAGGRMTGFVAAQTTPRVDGSLALGYYRPASVPVLTQLADHGVVFDRWFASVPGGGIANRLFAMSAHAVPDTPSVPAAGWPDVPVVFDRLQAAGVSWKVYVENYEPALTVSTAGPTALRGGQVARVPLLAMARYENSPALMSHITDLNAYYADLAAGRLPAVSWIVTTAVDRTASGGAVGRAARGPQRGERARRELGVGLLGVRAQLRLVGRLVRPRATAGPAGRDARSAGAGTAGEPLCHAAAGRPRPARWRSGPAIHRDQLGAAPAHGPRRDRRRPVHGVRVSTGHPTRP